MRSALIASLPRVACGVLTLLSAWQLWLFGNLFSVKSDKSRAIPVEMPRDLPSSQTADRGAAIAAAHLFGDAAAVQTNTTQELTDSPLALRGVVATNDAQSGYAIIETGQRSEHLYAIGDVVPGNYRLVNVFPEHVVLDRDGMLRSLRLPRTALLGAGASLLPNSLGQLVASEPETEPVEEEHPQIHPVQPVTPFIEKPVEWRDHD